ncbi:single-stranded DNA-binding protein [Pedobacter psychrodurus]|uniref:Single-stranded DNA-binding protein n=1 Tax=Pedobacter psychrodurus TaxID=2530456 RepID=A0A4R0Q7C2_9SPHI|nr:single-stranded DNA-binding protein [Pedobacter psychrodurus]TCD28775.1 single-stranded DNA-binding protein [Pedobacter psychrodurus]
MEITGRLTADAVLRTVSGDRKVIGFSIAINDTYRSGGEQKKVTTFIDCSYWMNTGIAEYLKKGGWVQLYGRIGVNAYMSGSGEAKASLTFHTTEIKLLGSNQRSESSSPALENTQQGVPKAAETAAVNKFEGIDNDLPF